MSVCGAGDVPTEVGQCQSTAEAFPLNRHFLSSRQPAEYGDQHGPRERAPIAEGVGNRPKTPRLEGPYGEAAGVVIAFVLAG